MLKWSPWDLPFFDARHAELARELDHWQQRQAALAPELETLPLPDQCRRLAAELGQAGLLRYAVPTQQGDTSPGLDLRSACMVREALSYGSALADFVFSMQGIGAAPLWLHGSAALRERYLDDCRLGRQIAAFALTEPEGGSDVAATATTATRRGDVYVLDGAKTYISNGGIADYYVVVARSEQAPGARGLSAFLVEAGTPGLMIDTSLEIVAPHPLATLHLRHCEVPAAHLLGAPGDGFRVAMSVLDIFRSSVGAAAVGIARRALDETVARMGSRSLFGKPMAEMDTVRMRVADMALDMEAAALLVYRAAWLRDVRQATITREAAMAKLGGTEAAFRVVDSAVQLFGALGITQGCVIEQLFRDVRPMRIYEGASEIQKLIIGRRVLGAQR
ncbi:acyl-CoA dehydrogenase family protein [Cupriavidus taiwanensis]|uniref:acyl-CoA dehydrogenase family protein n=1 Tax=Cupriavidus taiwanensis TaxID=164546 RepID=UPI001573A305|nr:acyl-CoA dehydrogenase family protein [Cupriavidus taiwanensis]NSX12974.1 acyl-CoA dehydrogenase family protein [Cupriavidus taiwanensis]